MTKRILICFFIILQFQVGAQNSWVNYLQSIKEKFYYKDTIIIKFQNGVLLDSLIRTRLVKGEEAYYNLFKMNEDTLVDDGGNGKYFFSYFLSKSNYATIVLYSDGMWNVIGNLYLYNYSPQGNLLQQIKLQDGWGDAGTDYKTFSKFENDSTFKVIHQDGIEKPDQNYYYEITEKDYAIKANGCILLKTQRMYEKTAQ